MVMPSGRIASAYASDSMSGDRLMMTDMALPSFASESAESQSDQKPRSCCHSAGTSSSHAPEMAQVFCPGFQLVGCGMRSNEGVSATGAQAPKKRAKAENSRGFSMVQNSAPPGNQGLNQRRTAAALTLLDFPSNRAVGCSSTSRHEAWNWVTPSAIQSSRCSGTTPLPTVTSNPPSTN